jgi:hypothetical protein
MSSRGEAMVDIVPRAVTPANRGVNALLGSIEGMTELRRWS